MHLRTRRTGWPDRYSKCQVLFSKVRKQRSRDAFANLFAAPRTSDCSPMLAIVAVLRCRQAAATSRSMFVVGRAKRLQMQRMIGRPAIADGCIAAKSLGRVR